MRDRSRARSLGMGSIAALMMSAVLLFAAPVPAGALEPGPARMGTWEGQVEAHSDGAPHYDYSGSACPVEDEVCIEILATYRIVPVTPEAGKALAEVAGGQARLSGVLLPGRGGHAMGILVVWDVAKV
jgi:hypothetical protein